MIRTRVGYAGGTTKNPTYQDIGDHTESFQVDYDPSKITYEQLLAIFWKSHDPASGSHSVQYRSAVFTMNEAQKKAALASKEKLEKDGVKVKTALEPLPSFTWAEDYHQKYTLRNNKAFLKQLQKYYPDEKALANSTAAARLNAYLAGDGKESLFEKEIGQLGLDEAHQKMLREKVKGRLQGDDEVAPAECGTEEGSGK